MSVQELERLIKRARGGDLDAAMRAKRVAFRLNDEMRQRELRELAVEMRDAWKEFYKEMDKDLLEKNTFVVRHFFKEGETWTCANLDLKSACAQAQRDMQPLGALTCTSVQILKQGVVYYEWRLGTGGWTHRTGRGDMVFLTIAPNPWKGIQNYLKVEHG